MKKFTFAFLLVFLAFFSSEAAEGIEYTSESLGFNLTLPTGWSGLYRVKESPNSVQFISIRNENADYGGHVFGILISDTKFTEENSHLGTGLEELAEAEGVFVYYTHPTDVQFDYENASLTNEYKHMEADVYEILKSFRFVNPAVKAELSSSFLLTNAKKFYYDYIDNNPADDPSASEYSLIDINGDGFPELLIVYGSGAEGCDLCTVIDGKFVVLKFSLCDLMYIEGKNLFVIKGGRMDSYFDYVYTIKNSEFVALHKGVYGAEDNSRVKFDTDDNPIYRYYWDGKEVLKTDYERSLKSVFDESKAISPRNSYTIKEIFSAISRL